MSTLDADLRAAHAAKDTAQLIALYQQAATQAAPAAERFFLTQAYVYALESGDTSSATALHQQLIALGCEQAVG